MSKRSTFKRIIAVVLSLALLLSIMAVIAGADESYDYDSGVSDSECIDSVNDSSYGNGDDDPLDNGENEYTSEDELEEGELEEGELGEGGFMGIMPFNLAAPSIAFDVYCSTTFERLQGRGDFWGPLPFNVASAVDAGFDDSLWPGWEIDFWTVAFSYRIPPPPIGGVLIASSDHSIIRPAHFVAGDPNGVGFLSVGPLGALGSPGANYQWATPVTFDIYLRPQPPTIEKEATDVASVVVGDIIEYTITVENPAILPNTWAGVPYSGPNPVPIGTGPPLTATLFNGFQVIDALPPGLSLVAGSVDVQGAVAYTDSSSGNTVSVSIDLPPATNATTPGEVEITFLAEVTDVTLATTGYFENTAELRNSANVVIDSDTENVYVATTLTGTVTCEKTGRPIPGVTIRLYEYNENTSQYVFLRQQVTNPNGFYDFGDISAGRTRVRMVESTIPTDYIVTFGGDRNWTAQPGGAYEEHFRVQPPLPTIEKSVSPTTTRPDTMVTYTITINVPYSCPVLFAAVIMNDPLSPAQALLDLTTVTVTNVTGISNPAVVYFCTITDTLRASNMQLESGATEVVITFTAYVCDTAVLGDTIVNTAFLSINTYTRNPAFDPDEPISGTNPIRIPTGNPPTALDNDSATVTITTDPGISKAASYAGNRLSPGGTVTYTLTIATNNLTAAQFSNVVVRDPLPSGLSGPFNLVSVNGATGHSHNFTGNVFEISGMQLNTAATTSGFVDTVTIIFTATVAANAPVGDITNTARLYRNESGTLRFVEDDDAVVTIPPPRLIVTVTCEFSNNPVGGVTVTVTEADGTVRTGVTGVDGTFDFGNIQVGNTVVTMSYNTIPSGYVVTVGGNRTWNARPGGSYQEDYYIAPAPTLTGTVTCEVTDREIPGVTIRLYERNEATGAYVFLRSETTDANGEFDFGEVPVGRIRVRMDYSTIPAGYVVTDGGNRDITTVPAQAYEEHFLIAPAPTLTGTVTCEDTNRPIPGATVRLYQRNAAGNWVFTGQVVQTNAAGFFDFGYVPVGELEIRVSNIPAGYAQRHGSRRGVITSPAGAYHEDFIVGIPSPLILKSASYVGNQLLRGGVVTYTITIDTDGMMGIDFASVVVRDPLHARLTNPGNITVTGVTGWSGGFTGNVLNINNMQLATSSATPHGYVTQVVITFTATVTATAPAGVIPNTAWLYYNGANPAFNENLPEHPTTNPRRIQRTRSSNANVTVVVSAPPNNGRPGSGNTGSGSGNTGNGSGNTGSDRDSNRGSTGGSGTNWPALFTPGAPVAPEYGYYYSIAPWPGNLNPRTGGFADRVARAILGDDASPRSVFNFWTAMVALSILAASVLVFVGIKKRRKM